MEKKITKRENFVEIVAELKAIGREDLAGVIEHEIELLDNKAAKAKATAAKKKVEGDALRDTVQAVLTDELQTIDAITAQIEGEDVSKSKVQYRLNALVANGLAEKAQITVGEGEAKRKLMSYRAAAAEAETEE